MKPVPADKRADELFSWVVRLRDERCVKCGRPDGLDAAHIFGRTDKRLRWNPVNAVALCRRCHRYYTDRSKEWQEFAITIIGQSLYETLAQIHRHPVPMGKSWAEYNAALLANELRKLLRLRTLEGKRIAPRASTLVE